MKMDHPPLMKEDTPKHIHHVHMVEKMHGGDGHKHHHHMYGQHAAGHMKEHEKVEKLCGGGMSKAKK
jgi:hypothetical protein